LSLLDIDALYFELERFKAERGWYNLNLPRTAIEQLLADPTWYRLEIPGAQMKPDSMEKVRLWQELAGVLLKRYVERYYAFCKHEWEMPHLEYRPLAADDRNFPRVSEDPPVGGYRVTVEATETETIARIQQLAERIERGDYGAWSYQGLGTIWNEDHLYRPLLFSDGPNPLEVSPVPLNKGERKFIDDLATFVEADRARGASGVLAGAELYVLRNLSRGSGVGFFEAGNFYPDFIIWVKDAQGTQHIAFVDPKGVRQVPASDPKVRFHETIKGIAERLGNPNIQLHSFIIAQTAPYAVERMWGLKRDEIEARGVLFVEDEKYVQKIISECLST
jgi:hypothetical protein